MRRAWKGKNQKGGRWPACGRRDWSDRARKIVIEGTFFSCLLASWRAYKTRGALPDARVGRRNTLMSEAAGVFQTLVAAVQL